MKGALVLKSYFGAVEFNSFLLPAEPGTDVLNENIFLSSNADNRTFCTPNFGV